MKQNDKIDVILIKNPNEPEKVTVSYLDEMDSFSKIPQNILDIIPLARKNDKKPVGIVLNASSEPFILDKEVWDIVENAANSGLWAGGGICGVIFKKAGMAELTASCNKYKTPLKDGSAVITPAFNMTNTNLGYICY